MNKQLKPRGLQRLFLLLALPFVSLSAMAYSKGETVTFNNISYKVLDVNKNTLCVIGGSGDSNGLMDIPSKVFDGKDITFTVVSIDGLEGATYTNVTSAKIPETVTRIEVNAFNGAKLSELTIPKTVTYIATSLSRFNPFPKFTVEGGNPNYESDADGALYNKGKTQLLAVPSSVEGTYTVASTVTKLYFPFRSASNLTKVVIPASVTSVGTGFPLVDQFCYALTAYEVDAQNSKFQSLDGLLCTKGGDKVTLVKVPYGKKMTGEYKVPDGITAVSTYAFQIGKLNLDRLDLNNVAEFNSGFMGGIVKEIHLGKPFKDIVGFFGSVDVTKITVDEENPNYSTDDKGVLFNKEKTELVYYCTASPQTTYDIPATVTTVDRRAFMGAKNLTAITVPYTVTKLGEEAFRDCKKLATLTFEDTDEHPAQIKELPHWMLYRNDVLTTLTLPRSLKTVKGASIYYCTALKTINVPDGSKLTKLEANALEGSDNLEAFKFNGSTELDSIGTSVFQYKKNLNHFVIPATVTTIDANAFQGCSGLTNLKFADGSTIQTISAGAFSDCGVTSITIPESVTTIEREAFRNCKALAKVSLSKNTTSVSPEAFKYCTNLSAFTVDEANPTYSAVLGMLCDKDKNTLEIFPAGQANKELVLLPPSLTAIGDYAFYDCQNLTNVVIPQKVERIGKRAFGLDAKLTSIAFLCDKMIDPANINQKLNEWSFDDGSDAAPLNMFGNINIYVRKELADGYRNSTFYQKFKGIKTSFSVKHEDNVNEELVDEYMPLSDNAMSLLSTKAQVNTFVLGSVTSPEDNVTRNVYMIGDYAFEGSDVKEVVCRNNIEAIGAMAFVTKTEKTTSGTTTSVKPVSSSIKSIFFCGKEPATQLSSQNFELNSDFNEFFGDQKVYVRKSCLDTYKKAWPTFADRIDYKIPDAKVSNKYGTFAREFDVDLADYFKEKGESKVLAFTEGEARKGTGDYGDETAYHVHMTSIGTDGTVIPANTGVLLKVMDKVATSDGFYYCIAENDGENTAPANAVMKGVTVRDKSVSGSNVYVMQGGQFRRLGNQTIDPFPVHKAYLQIDGIPADAQIKVTFDDDVTGITSIENNAVEDANQPVYTLSGQRVSKPTKGIYVKGGKKFIVK